MVLRRVIRWTFYVVVASLAIVVVFIVCAVGPVDRTPMEDLAAYDEMKTHLDRLKQAEIPAPSSGFSVGFAAVNLTPSYPTATAGYGNRRGKIATGVRDSLFVRTMVIDNGTERVAVVAADLLIIPPLVTQVLEKKLAAIGFSLSNTFLGATHTHNGIGNWGKGATRFIYGKYDEKIVDFIAERVVESISLAQLNLAPAQMKSGRIAIPEGVNNRLINGGFEDPYARIVEIHRNDSSKLILVSYTAHATCLFSKDVVLSRDYPGALVDSLEAKGYDFAMFMAGAVASHGFGAPMAGDECIAWMAEKVSSSILENRSRLASMTDTSLMMVTVPLPLSCPQVKISEDFKVRKWLFQAAFGEYPAFLTALRIGDIVLLGTPADFSGAFNPVLDSIGARYDLTPMVTGFNGGYIGYLTPREMYDHDHYETRFMNWYAPGTGEYMQQSLAGLIEILSE